jgi:glycosyltransferase involved in cell wall biosynthesis
LNQTHEPTELIIIDDCSSDDACPRIAALAANDHRIKFIQHKRNAGASASRNDGLNAATGDFIAFCDADDLWLPEKLAIQIRLLNEHPEHDVVYTEAVIIDEQGKEAGTHFSDLYPLPQKKSGTLFESLCLRNFVNMQTVLIRRKCLENNLRFDTSIKWVEDWWYWIQLSHNHKFMYVSRALAKYRVHSASTSITKARGIEINRFKVYRHILQTYRDLSSQTVIRIYYHLGSCLRNIGWTLAARHSYGQSINYSLRDWRHSISAVRPVIKWIILFK